MHGEGKHRDSSGRFRKGNPGGPGNPNITRQSQFKRAVEEATTPEDILRVLQVLKDLALGGDVTAARTWLDRVLGKPTQASGAEFDGIELPDISTASGVVEGCRAVFGALRQGSIDPSAAMQIGSVLELARRAVETQQLEVRVAELERTRRPD